MSTRPIPQHLKIVAYLFILGGVLSVLDVILSLLGGKIKIDFGVLAIFIGRGLLRLNPNSHTWALVFTWIGMIVSPFATLLFLFNPGDINIFGLIRGPAPPGLGFIMGVGLTAVVYWQYAVLNNAETRRLFGKIT